MGFSKKISDFYDRAQKVLATVLEYLALIGVIALFGGVLFDAVQKVPPEGGSPSGGVVFYAPTPSYQFQSETYLVGAILGLSTVGVLALFRAANTVGERRYAAALATLGIVSLIVAIIGIIVFAVTKVK